MPPTTRSGGAGEEKGGDSINLDTESVLGWHRVHPHVKKVKGHRVVTYREEWCTYSNFSDMYTRLYEQMEKCGFAVKLQEPQWQNIW